MVEASTKKPAIPYSTILEVISFLESKDIFKGGANRLNKRIYSQLDQIRKFAIRHLGIIEDYDLEREYLSGLLKDPTVTFTPHYDTKEKCYKYLNTFLGIKSHKIMLFGFLSVGGSDRPV